MRTPPIPVVFEPLFKPKPWGGRRLATLLDKSLPPDELIGESWELVSLPGNESHVRDGPIAGRALCDLVTLWGHDLLGDAALADGRFPLLIKFLDARENLSVQVHPKPAADDPVGRQPGVKHEAWYVLHAEPGARIFAGVKPGVGPADMARVANTPDMVRVLHTWDAQAGQCYYLPSGTLHALGAGVVVAEIQTPSDTTYSAYDWEHVGLDGRPRELHVEQALAHIRYDVPDSVIRPPSTPGPPLGSAAQRLVQCECFTLDGFSAGTGYEAPLPPAAMAVWIVLRGVLEFSTADSSGCMRKGDVTLIPAHSTAPLHVRTLADTDWLQVTIPARKP